MKKFDLASVQKALSSEGTEGWLLYDFQGSDPIARRVLGISSEKHLTRRWFYFVPASGAPIKLVHKIEPAALDHLPGEKRSYAGWRELDRKVGEILHGRRKVAMNYSPGNAIPYVSRVDAGTVEFVRSKGIEVSTAADLVQQFEAVMDAAQLKTHVRAAKHLREIVDLAFDFVAKHISKKKKLTEYDVQQFICNQFRKRKLVTDSPPIVSIGPNSGNPHYAPSEKEHKTIRKGDFLLIDLWAREDSDRAVYADITWTGYLGPSVPEKYARIFNIVAGARDAALKTVEDAASARRTLRGKEVDDAARNFITAAGYGEYFVHRTGHNIGNNVHGNGAHMDNFETREERKVLPNTCFSIEPGIYLDDFGVRSEIDVFYNPPDVKVYGQPIQTEVVAILK